MLHPELAGAALLIRAGRVLVDGFPVRNPASLVRAEAAIAVVRRKTLRGERKLQAALRAFGLDVSGRIALDVGAAAGGFTRVLLDAGARRVYAVDAGHGQLRGSLRLDRRVVNLEGVNLGGVDRGLVPDAVDLITVDVSYLSLAAAVPQLERVAIAPDAELVALVKPQFELGLARTPTDPALLAEAVRCAATAIERCGWRVAGTVESPLCGAKGAVEFFVHARRA